MKGRKSEKKEARTVRAMPSAFVPRDGAYIARGAVREGGVLLLVYEISLPALQLASEGGRSQAKEKEARAQARISDFYARIAEEIWRGCAERLFPSVRRAYEESDDPQKKYRFARYTLTVDFTQTRAAGEIVILRHARLLRRGRVICERAWEERFCERNGRVQLRRLSRLLSRIRPKQGLKETLKSVISRHTGG